MSPKQEIKLLRQALKVALRKWQEADWHWNLEFSKVCDNSVDHVPPDDKGEHNLYKHLVDLVNGKS